MDRFIILDRNDMFNALRLRLGSAVAGQVVEDLEAREHSELVPTLRINAPRPKEADECGCQG